MFHIARRAAAATSTIGLGSMVVNVANRNPGLMATAAASVQTISGGRLHLGLGAGAAPGTKWSGEHDTLGIALRPTMAARHAVLVETLDHLDAMWSADASHVSTVSVAASAATGVGGGEQPSSRRDCGPQRADGVTCGLRTPKRRRSWPPPATLSERGDFWSADLLDPSHPKRRTWEGWGVSRVVLVGLTDRLTPDQISARPPTQ